jgi:phage terminase large subunit-like protein
MTVRAADVITFIHRNLRIPDGPRVGQPLILESWQQAELRAIYDNPAGTRRAILSRGRKNAKTTTAAALLLAHLCGPPARDKPNSQLVSAAQSRDQAGLIFFAGCKMIRLNPDLARIIRIKESGKELHCRELGTVYRALSAEAHTAFGLNPSFTVFDELGRCYGPRSQLYEALETATGSQRDALTIIISTQAPNDGDLLSLLIDDAKLGYDPRVVLSLHTAPPELDPFAEETIKLANPGWGTIINPKEVLAMASDAKRMPAREAQYRNLILNQRVEVNNPFVSLSAWAACGDSPAPLDGLEVYAGLDLSATTDLTALVLIGRKAGGKWHVHPHFWLPTEGLLDRAIADRAPYDEWRARGYLQTTPGRVVSYDWVAQYLRRQFTKYNIKKVAFDRWNFKHFKPWLERAGFTAQMIEERFVEFGQGLQSMSPALRDLEQVILEHQLAHGGHPVLTACITGAVIEQDAAGNRKVNRKRSTSRVDGLIALAMAIGAAPLVAPKVDIRTLIA